MMLSDSSLSGCSSTPASSVDSLPESPKLLASRLADLYSIQNAPQAGALEPAPKQIRKVCFVGAGYVGGPTAAVMALKNPAIKVTVVDKDEARIMKWKSKHLPIYEPGLGGIVRIARDGTEGDTIPPAGINDASFGLYGREPNLFFSSEDIASSISEADVVFLSVNTPTKLTGIGAGSATNMTALHGATRDIALVARPGAIIVEKSTVPCGTAQIIRDTLELYQPGVAFEVLSNPEFLAEGTAIKDLLSPDRILIGSSQTASGMAAAAALKQLYSSWVPPTRIVTVNLWSSELSKLVANAMLAQRISSINTISAICECTGADVSEISRVIGLDPRLGPKFLQSGVGFGGSCFKKDILSLIYLATSFHLLEVAEYWLQVLKINEYQRDRFVNRVVSSLHGTLVGKKIAIFGYAFKKNTSDTRESPSVEVVKSLLHDNPAEIAIFDPRCDPEDVKDELKRLIMTTDHTLLKPEGPINVYNNSYEASMNATAVLVLTDSDQFRYPPQPLRDDVVGEEMERPASSASVDRPESSERDISALLQTISTLTAATPEPACPRSCHECSRAQPAKSEATLNVDWDRISCAMKLPKLVFDGRGVVDASLEDLGFQVETIGKAGSALRSKSRSRSRSRSRRRFHGW